MFGFPFSHGWPSRFHIWDIILNPLTNSLHHFSRWWNVAPPTSYYIPISPLNFSPILCEFPWNFPHFPVHLVHLRQKTTRPSHGGVCDPPGVWRLTKRRPAPRRNFLGVDMGKNSLGEYWNEFHEFHGTFFLGVEDIPWMVGFFHGRIVVEYWIPMNGTSNIKYNSNILLME